MTEQQLKLRIGKQKKKTHTQSYFNMIGNQTTIPSHCDGKVVIATGWLAGHEIQLKNATKSQKKRQVWVKRLPSVNCNYTSKQIKHTTLKTGQNAV